MKSSWLQEAHTSRYETFLVVDNVISLVRSAAASTLWLVCSSCTGFSDGSYIYEEFLATDGTDVKVWLDCLSEVAIVFCSVLLDSVMSLPHISDYL
jgi:hypothetical protein